MKTLRTIPIIFLPLILSGIVYSLGWSDFWLLDDFPNLVENPYLRFDATQFEAWRVAAFSSDSGALNRPLAMLTFAAQNAVEGELSATTSKAVDTGLHLFIGYLLYRLLSTLAPRLLPGFSDKDHQVFSLLATALWLLSPLLVSTVLYPVQRMAQLSTLGVIVGLLVFTHYRERFARSGGCPGEVVSLSIWLSLAGIAAILAKENGAVMLWLLPLFEVAIFRGQWKGRQSNFLLRCAWLALLAPLILVCAVFLLKPEWVYATYDQRSFTMGERVLTQLRLLWQYTTWLVIPSPGSYGLFHDGIVVSRGWLEPISTLVSAVAWLSAIALSFLLRRKTPVVLFATGFYLICHSIESSVLALELVFEHRNYLPAVGVYVLLAAGLVAVSRYLTSNLRVLCLVLVPLIFLLQLVVRVERWSDESSLAFDSYRNHPESLRAHVFFANDLQRVANEARENNLDTQIVAQYMGGARHEYEVAHQKRPQALAPLAMLYLLDSSYFSGLGVTDRWLDTIVEIVSQRPLTATDSYAIKSVLQCVATARCSATDSKLESLFAALEQSNLGAQRVAMMRYEYARAASAPELQRLTILQDALADSPNALPLLGYLAAEYLEQGRLGEAFRVRVQMYPLDKFGRYQLFLIPQRRQ